MNRLRTRIGTTKRQLINITGILDSIYLDISRDLKSEEDELEKLRLELVAKEIELHNKQNNKDKERIILKITQRMVNLNKNKVMAKPILDGKLDELARLLDWIEEL